MRFAKGAQVPCAAAELELVHHDIAVLARMYGAEETACVGVGRKGCQHRTEAGILLVRQGTVTQERPQGSPLLVSERPVLRGCKNIGQLIVRFLQPGGVQADALFQLGMDRDCFHMTLLSKGK